jgi:hypothetical protein
MTPAGRPDRKTTLTRSLDEHRHHRPPQTSGATPWEALEFYHSVGITWILDVAAQ